MIEKIRDDFNSLFKDDLGYGYVTYSQNLYWTARWNGLTVKEVCEVISGPLKEEPFRLLSDRELYHD